MSHNADSEKPKLKLLKRHVPIPARVIDEFDFDLELGSPDDLVEFTKSNMATPDLESSTTFSELLEIQKKSIDKIKYYADELEFNLD